MSPTAQLRHAVQGRITDVGRLGDASWVSVRKPRPAADTAARGRLSRHERRALLGGRGVGRRGLAATDGVPTNPKFTEGSACRDEGLLGRLPVAPQSLGQEEASEHTAADGPLRTLRSRPRPKSSKTAY